MSGDKQGVRIIVKKKGGHGGGHHGGAWKVAYADFVTAMMAFFMVMWIMGMDAQQKDLIQGYFQNPVGFKKGFGAGQNPMSAGNAIQHMGARTIAIAARDYQQGRFMEAADRIRLRLSEDPELAKLAGNFEVLVTNEGMRIEMIDAGSGDRFFAVGSGQPLPPAQRALSIIGRELTEIANDVVIEGHTDARPYGTSRDYSNWELSADRANAARRVLTAAGIVPTRVREVRGHADRALRVASNPFDPANRRVSILIPFSAPDTVNVPVHSIPAPATVASPVLPTPPVADPAS
jgi:chemotaxis protein MotB